MFATFNNETKDQVLVITYDRYDDSTMNICFTKSLAGLDDSYAITA